MSKFRFALGAAVILATSAALRREHRAEDAEAESQAGGDQLVKVAHIGRYEAGHVIARSESLEGDNQYFVRYRAADGRQVEQWWTENAIEQDDEGADLEVAE